MNSPECLKPLAGRRALALVGWTVALVILAISPRALLAPVKSFNRSEESKRPKMPKNVVRAESNHASNIERLSRALRPPSSLPVPTLTHDLQVRIALAPGSAGRSIPELTQPEYLRHSGASPPRNGLSPPA